MCYVAVDFQDSLECTDWDVVIDVTDNIEDAALAILGYIQFCEDVIIPYHISLSRSS